MKMAFCEMCGVQIPDGQTRCASCAAPQAAPKAASSIDFDNVTATLNNQLGALKQTNLNWIGLVAQIFNILMLCLPVMKRLHIWEIADLAGRFYFIAFGVILAILASAAGYLLKKDKIANIAGIVNLVAFLIVWFCFYDTTGFTVGFYFWLIGVVIQLVSPLGMKLFKQYVK